MDGITDFVENASACLDANNADTKYDGISDGEEDLYFHGAVDPGETDPSDPDTDGDNVQDCTEKGVIYALEDPDVQGALQGADEALFQPDLEPLTLTDTSEPGSDEDGMTDGQEYANANGVLDPGETNHIAFLFVDQNGLCDNNTPCMTYIQGVVEQAGFGASFLIAEGDYDEFIIVDKPGSPKNRYWLMVNRNPPEP